METNGRPYTQDRYGGLLWGFWKLSTIASSNHSISSLYRTPTVLDESFFIVRHLIVRFSQLCWVRFSVCMTVQRRSQIRGVRVAMFGVLLRRSASTYRGEKGLFESVMVTALASWCLKEKRNLVNANLTTLSRSKICKIKPPLVFLRFFDVLRHLQSRCDVVGLHDWFDFHVKLLVQLPPV